MCSDVDFREQDSDHSRVRNRPKRMQSASGSPVAAASPRVIQVIGTGIAVGLIPACIHNAFQGHIASVAVLGVEEAVVLTALLLNRRGATRAASRMMPVSGVALAATLQISGGRGVHDVATLIFPGAIVVGAVLLDRRWFVATTAAAMVAVALQYVLELSGVYRNVLSPFTAWRFLIDAEVILAVTAVAVGLLMGNLRQSLAKAEASAARLAESEERYRTLFESVSDAILVLDLETWRVVDANRQASELFARPPESLRELSAGNLGADQPGGSLVELARRASPADGNGTELFEWQAQDAFGRMFWTEVNLRQALIDGQARLLVSVRDVDERKRHAAERERVEEQLRNAQKFESLGRLAGGVAHDLNNLLTCIMGNLDLAREREVPGGSVSTHLGEIQHASQRAAELVGQLLAFSCQQPIAPKPLSLPPLLESVQRLLGRLLGENIKFAVDTSAGLWAIHADAGQLEQMLLNLAVNARDAMPSGGRLTISAQNLVVSPEFTTEHPQSRPGRFVCIRVEDTGVGMDQATLEHIFEPFFTTKPRGKGTGLGLAMVFGAVQQNRGFVVVESRPGNGSAFQLFFPECTQTPSAVPARGVPAAVPTGSERVLLVEDDDLVRQVTGRMLKRLGYSFVACRDTEEALAAASRERFDVLLTDVVLPGLDGHELAEHIAALQPKIRILFSSGYDRDIIGSRGIIRPGLEFIPKPFAIRDLAQKLRAVIEEED
jgi:two-component system, cell cycle sensor histidine kinase and response regulator CckA